MTIQRTSTTLSLDNEKFLAADLIRRSHLKLVMSSICDKVQMQQGAGLQAHFIRYKRIEVPLTTVPEGNESGLDRNIELSTVTVTLDQYADIIYWTDVVELVTSHDLPAQVMKLLADSAARVMDREITNVLLAGTNVIYGDGAVTTRNTIASSMRINDALINRALVLFSDRGVPPRGSGKEDSSVDSGGSFRGGGKYIAICGPQVLANIRDTGTSLGTWVSVAMYANQKALYNAEVGEWLGVRWVETNFIPKFTMYGNITTAITPGPNAMGVTGLTVGVPTTGGNLSNGTYYVKATVKDNLRGFEEQISIEHTVALSGGGSTQAITFQWPSTAGLSYQLYAGSSSGDANLRLVAQNVAPGATTTIGTIPGSGANPPQSLNTSSTPSAVHPVFMFGDEAVNWVGFYKTTLRRTSTSPIIGNVLDLKRAAGYKFFGKAMIRDEDRVLRLELASNY